MADAPNKSETVLREEEILAFWKREGVFEQSLTKPAPKGDFVFYDGPPFATGLPHTGSLLSSVIKDVIPRYKTMQGYRVPRVWGWDCHGLPIESLVEKKLGLKTKKDILDIGIDTFNETARSLVLQYVDDWEKYVDRVGRWVDFKNSYKTMDNSYIESVWWALKQLDNKKLLYEGRKVLMYCTHCETPLAKAEIAMDNTYKDVTEEAITVKFKVKHPERHDLPPNTYLLAWTTTPWTLPGNVALAVGEKIEYGIVEVGTEHHLSATASGSIFGSDLVGIEYEPVFAVPALQSSVSYKVRAADFVSTEEGTGIVHIAPMYGEDDFVLGQANKLPMVQLLQANGHYTEQAPEFLRGEYFKKADKLVKEDLEGRGLLFAREMHTHSYPHCYRCGTPLIYNAVSSWFINIQAVKSKMLAENERVSWFPEHLKHGRFKHIVENAPDWTISRNRFWASPLPVWKEKGGNKLMVIGSLEELLAKTKRSGNRYFVMRHGQCVGNVSNIEDLLGDPKNHLTDQGKQEVAHAATELRREAIDLIIASPFVRTQETAKIIQRELGLPDSALMTDERLHEADSADQTVRARVGEFLFEVERRYAGKNILFVSHGDPIWTLQQVAARAPKGAFVATAMLRTAEWRELLFTPFPHNRDYELDLHRPYIDSVVLTDGQGGKYERIPEVIDCWVESGSMPFASMQYPKDKSKVDPGRWFGLFPKNYPGDFIAEYIAQTRTWFYYMHAMGVLLFGQRAFKSVVSTGTILAADGSKMSKSKGNYTDPYELMDKYGADALRLSLMGSVVMQGEDLNFRDDDVKEAHNRIIGILWNSYKFTELYREQYDGVAKAQDSTHVLDRWINSLLAQTIRDVTAAMESYDMPSAIRALRDFVQDYSTWYLRRSRDRVKVEGADKQSALATQLHVLFNVARLCAPVAPFIAESISRGLGGKEGSVHLAPWPQAGVIDEPVLKEMAAVRELASVGLKLREGAGSKVRQPLARFTVTKELSPEFAAILRDELNVKEVAVGEQTELDTTVTPELREEGVVRELIRRIQDLRKEQGLTIQDRPAFTLALGEEEAAVARKHTDALVQATNLRSLTITDASNTDN